MTTPADFQAERAELHRQAIRNLTWAIRFTVLTAALWVVVLVVTIIAVFH